MRSIQDETYLVANKSSTWERELARSTVKEEGDPNIPDLSTFPFSTRTLVEGLIGHGIVYPGDVSALLKAVQGTSVVLAFHDRVLTALFAEERIRNVTSIVRSKTLL
jgi:hypothetical protein